MTNRVEQMKDVQNEGLELFKKKSRLWRCFCRIWSYRSISKNG